MKKTIWIGLGLSLALTGCKQSDGSSSGLFWAILLAVLGIVLLAGAALRTYSFFQLRKRLRRRRKRAPRRLDGLTCLMYVLAAAALLGVVLLCAGKSSGSSTETTPPTTTAPTQESTEPPVPTSPILAQMTADSDPANWTIRWEVFQGSSILHSYAREEAILFDAAGDYFALPGIATFRGNNLRSTATYGTADVTQKTLSKVWTSKTGTLAGSVYSGSSWAGSGWTGQPLMVQWDDATKQIMNMYTEKKAKTDLVEVIYATLDGRIYFLDLDDGSYTRDPIEIGMAFKGAGALDPRGYPLMYVGSGDVNSTNDRPRMYIISLIDGTVLYEGGHNETLSYRTDNDNWCAFDSSPLVDAETDTLIWPGENGLLYTIKLNTNYNKAAGTLSIAPDTPVFTRYLTARSTAQRYWYGYEASANIVGSYLYVSENGGMFYCVDLNTMELVWAQDTKDDSNSSPVFEYVSSDECYVYTAPSLHWTRDETFHGKISLYKLDALTGQIVWEKPYNVTTLNNLSGGVQSTPLLGQPGTSIEGMIIYTIARTPVLEEGLIVALDTDTGEEIWRRDMEHYSWSSPVAVNGSDGTTYVVVCDTNGNMLLLNGATGELLNTINLGGTIQASPAVYENMLVVGNRVQDICGIRID